MDFNNGDYNSYINIGIREARALYRSRILKNETLRKFFRGKDELETILSKFFPSESTINSREALEKFTNTDIFLKKGKLYEGGEILFHFPVVPGEFSLQAQNENEKVSTPAGAIKFIREHGLRAVSWSCFFPSKGYSFSKNNELSEWDCYEEIEKIRKMGEPIELVVTGTRINFEVLIESFDVTLEANGDLAYTITFSEFKYPQVDTEINEKDYWKPEQTEEVKKTKKVTFSQKDGKPIYPNYALKAMEQGGVL